jgi:hypothetical protein
MNVTLEMLVAVVGLLGLIATVVSIFVGRFSKVDERQAAIEKDLAEHKVRSASTYVTMEALARFDERFMRSEGTFEERLARTEERVLSETRALRSDLSSMLAASPRANPRRRSSATDESD